MAALILGEIAHHNLLPLAVSLNYSRPRIRAALATPEGRAALLPSNAYSIASSIGVPRETVRRKVAALVRRGLLVRHGRGDLFLNTQPGTYSTFDPSGVESIADLLRTAESIAARSRAR